MKIGIAREDLLFDDRDLAAATLDSCGLLEALPCNLVERSPVAFQNSLLARVLLVTPHNAIRVLGIDFHQARLATEPVAPD